MSKEDRLEPGTRVRLKATARAMSGWKGTGTILYSSVAIKDGRTDPTWDTMLACPWQWSVMRDQTPNPEHAEAVRDPFGAHPTPLD
jgi:hypothetical protein